MRINEALALTGDKGLIIIKFNPTHPSRRIAGVHEGVLKWKVRANGKTLRYAVPLDYILSEDWESYEELEECEVCIKIKLLNKQYKVVNAQVLRLMKDHLYDYHCTCKSTTKEENKR